MKRLINDPADVVADALRGIAAAHPELRVDEVATILEKAGVGVARSLVGSYITSLEMAGCSVTLLKADEDLLRLWDAPVRTPALRWGV